MQTTNRRYNGSRVPNYNCNRKKKKLILNITRNVEDFFNFFFFVYKFVYFIYLFLAVLGLHCCAWAFSSCGERGLLFVAVYRLLIAVASLVADQGL